jgi:hypothetical protein
MGATETAARRAERAREWSRPRLPLRKRGEVVVADGYGVSVRVQRGRLVITDGAGRDRRRR